MRRGLSNFGSQRSSRSDNLNSMKSVEYSRIRKWAAPQSVVVSCWILLGISILAAASWLAADRITPAIRSTSITLVPQLQSDEQMGEEALVNWKAMHEKQIRSDGFIRDVAQRSAAR